MFSNNVRSSILSGIDFIKTVPCACAAIRSWRILYHAQLNTNKSSVRSKTLYGLSDTSKAYFLQATLDGYYEIIFGDGVFGKKVTTGNYIEISYLVTNGDKTNSSKNFVYNGQLTDENSVFIAVVESSTMTENASYGGSGIETIDSPYLIADFFKINNLSEIKNLLIDFHTI